MSATTQQGGAVARATLTAMRQPTLETLGLGAVLELFRRGALPADADALVERVFGPKHDRGSLVISGANAIVGAGKAMQLGARLKPTACASWRSTFPARRTASAGSTRAWSPRSAATAPRASWATSCGSRTTARRCPPSCTL